ncbi:MAG: YciI family protein [Devosia sp.]
MQYLMLHYADEKAGAEFSAEDMGRAMDIMGAYNAVLKKAGVLIMTAPLQQTDAAKTISIEGGEVSPGSFANEGGALKVHDGPYADTREQLGGFYLINAANMAEALEWAAKCPAAQWGSIEVRELFSQYADTPKVSFA